jgi:hypothetical protein
LHNLQAICDDPASGAVEDTGTFPASVAHEDFDWQPPTPSLEQVCHPWLSQGQFSTSPPRHNYEDGVAGLFPSWMHNLSRADRQIHIVFVGAGAVGCFYASRLHHVTHPLSLSTLPLWTSSLSRAIVPLPNHCELLLTIPISRSQHWVSVSRWWRDPTTTPLKAPESS